MNRLLRLATSAAVAGALLLAPAACKKTEEQEQAEAKFDIKASPVSEQERARAGQEVQQLWADAKISSAVKAWSPAAEHVGFYRDLAVLTQHSHRLAGYGQGRSERVGDREVQVFENEPGSLFAGHYVANRLKAMGVEYVLTQTFPVVQSIVTQCELQVAGEDPTYGPAEGFHVAQPNHLQGSITPAEGLTGKTVYAGGGHLADYKAPARDAVVVLDFDAADRWRYAFAMGAKAVIFVGADEPAQKVAHHVTIPANLPRFYATAELAERLKLKTQPRTVTIKASCRWEMREGRNVVGVLRGRQPQFDHKIDEAIVLAAPLDSLSEVPRLSPGARGAANCAALLALAEHFQANRPRRDVIVCFFDGDATNHAGARAFYGSLYRQRARGMKTTVADRLKMFEDETAHFEDILKVLAMGDIFTDEAKDMPKHRDAHQMMRRLAKDLASDVVGDELQLSRIDKRKHEARAERLEMDKRALIKARGAAPGGAAPDTQPSIEDIDRQIKHHEDEAARLAQRIEPMRQEDLSWSNLQGTIHDRKLPDPAAEPDLAERESKQKILEKYHLVLEETKRICRSRIQSLAEVIERQHQAMRMNDAVGPDRNLIVLHLSVNLGDASGRWAFIHGYDSQAVHVGKDNLGTYARMFQAIRDVPEDLRQAGGEGLKLFEGRTVEGLFNIRMFAPGLFAHSGCAAGLFGVANLAIMTPLDRRARDGQPCDVASRTDPDGKPEQVLKVENMLAALGEIRPFVGGLGDSDDMSLTSNISSAAEFTEVTFDGGKHSGASVLMLSAASVMPERPAWGSFMAVTRAPAKIWEGARVDQFPPGFMPYFVTRVNEVGRFELPPLSRDYYGNSLLVGAIHDGRGLIRYVTNTKTLKSALPLTNHQTILFEANSCTVVGLGFDRRAVNTRALKASSTAPLLEDRSLVAEGGNILALYAKQGTDRVKLFNQEGMVILGNAPPADPIVGEGVPMEAFGHLATVEITADEVYRLNQGRLTILRDNGILENSIEQLHVDSADVNAAAGKVAQDDVHRATGTKAASAAISRRVYPTLLRVLNDLVVAVVLLLLLSIPFAYSIERLLIGSPHIYRQIGWFVLFFLITFAVLYMVNPAFRIAATPIVIFLAFGIILLSTIVIVIMTRKLESEVRRMQGLGTTVHSADVSRLSTMMAAVSMGISTMRRRPVRTLLTAVTVVLLTFTILTFASFTSGWGNRRTYSGPMSGPPRLLVRHPVWTRIDEEIPEMLDGFLRGQAAVVPRYWVAQTASEVQAYKDANRTQEVIVANAAGDRVVAMAALVGLDYADVQRLPKLREVLGGDPELLRSNGVYLTTAVIGQDGLRLNVGDPVVVEGVPCTLAGVVEPREITTYTQLEGSSALPVDYEASSGGAASDYQAAETASLDDLPETESAQFVNFGADRVAIVPAELARKLGGRVCSFAVYPNEGVDIKRMADQVATVTRLPTYLGSGGGVYRLFFTSLTEASGWKDLIIPVVLGGLIIFATMLGSVSDREKEIYAFSALGLAPPHVAGLFFAEAAVYAVVGGMGGYLLGQVVSRVLNGIARLEWFETFTPPTMNYSSTNAIVTVLVVMCTVLISTIYPAVKASRSANPGIQRSWRIGRPKGDRYDLVFPFTVSAYDITGVVSFLREHFRNFSDTALGVFATASVHVFRKTDGKLGMQAQVALAPFDLGVSQRFALMAQPSEIEGIEEIRILLRRISGTRGDWQRANRVFINELRKQLLIWRSLSPDIMERYRRTTLEQWDELPVEDLRAETFGDSP